MQDKNNIVADENIDQRKADHKKLKKRMIIALTVILALMIILFAISFFIDKYYEEKRKESDAPIDFDFYPADFEENIFDNEEYMALVENGFILYTDSSSNLTLGIDRDSAARYGDDIAFMVDYIYTIINGNAEVYNGLFSDFYYEDNNEVDRFTMQKLYNVNLVKIASSESDSGEYTEYQFSLEYQIMENNGTFRNDIGAGSKKQYILISDKGGELLIDSISTSSFR